VKVRGDGDEEGVERGEVSPEEREERGVAVGFTEVKEEREVGINLPEG
jgi:hypothetical protein